MSVVLLPVCVEVCGASKLKVQVNGSLLCFVCVESPIPKLLLSISRSHSNEPAGL